MSKHPDSESHEGFVSRWSRRKSSVRQGDAANSNTTHSKTPVDPPQDPTLDNLLNPQDNKAADASTDNQALTRLPTDNAPDSDQPDGTSDTEPAEQKPLPSIDSLTEQSDYSAFMSPEVSQEIRNLALRKLFQSPMFNIRDGLDDYDDDFTTFEKLGDIVTADMRHHAERKQREQAERELTERDPLAPEQPAQADQENQASNTAQNPETADSEIASTERPADPADRTDGPSDQLTSAPDHQATSATDPHDAASPDPLATNNRPALSGKLRRRPEQS